MIELTKQEEEAMQVIWNCNGGFVKDFLDVFKDPKPPYTTLASTVKNLEKKGYVKGEKLGNSFRYLPVIKAEDYKNTFMKNFVGDYFKNSYKELVTFFAREKKISPDELREIINMIEDHKSE
ncbi:BlaI/MecI/CopY family transcriptional regulator [Pararcticibacter amylolyticus]|uniref:Transcriptional regulator n=1 Tax=Pararcticibacter amylolyticus TaxID=2173175 RepID=A0A2U2PG73_9SPHI|nr:BlaI/MecI/CopY family transcriptional regulator [Pararcticibacter amylolyticus]PWG80405.1 transcriptional regulator [Pararcticibacter amylolyticus]